MLHVSQNMICGTEAETNLQHNELLKQTTFIFDWKNKMYRLGLPYFEKNN